MLRTQPRPSLGLSLSRVLVPSTHASGMETLREQSYFVGETVLRGPHTYEAWGATFQTVERENLLEKRNSAIRMTLMLFRGYAGG